MRERRSFVQLIHPGGEHSPDQGRLKFWNRAAKHRRKFLRSRGRYVDCGELKEGEIVFWGEWEPDSRVIAFYTDRVPDGPRFLYEPFLVDDRDETWKQNTDPFVFGEHFLYTGCLQHTRRGPTQMRFLAPGSLVLFGSCLRYRFVLDTVFVVRDFVDHSARDWKEKLDRRVSGIYRMVTLEPWYRASLPDGQSHRLYFGATPEEPIGEMFSFFPCQHYAKNCRGFARPEVCILDFVTPQLTQGKKIARDLSLGELGALWRTVVSQVEAQGFSLGTHAELPRARQR